jgi:uncharacterized protein YjiS (DUF1127 family)
MPTHPRLIRYLDAALRWWNGLPRKRLTRRGLMELSDDQLAELGMPARRCRILQPSSPPPIA